MTDRYTVTATAWESGWELRITGPDGYVGTTQTYTGLQPAEDMARDYIALDRGVDPGSFAVTVRHTMPGWEVSPGLLRLAEDWAMYADVTERKCQGTPFSTPCELPHDVAGCHLAPIKRCRACGEEIFPVDQVGVLRHLLTSHGFRMDGRQFDNQNQELGRV